MAVAVNTYKHKSSAVNFNRVKFMRKVKRFLKSGAQLHYIEILLNEAQYSGGYRLYYKSNQTGEAPDHVLFTFMLPNIQSPSSL
jgi:hypothetical protein